MIHVDVVEIMIYYLLYILEIVFWVGAMVAGR